MSRQHPAQRSRTPHPPPSGETPAATDATRAPGPMRVRAIKIGFYDNTRRREGDVFTIAGPHEFSKVWMVEEPGEAPTRTRTAAQRGHAAILEGAKPPADPTVDEVVKSTGDRDPLGDD